MDSFEFNKIAGAVLIAALVAFGLGALSDFIFAGHQAETPGYIIEVAETGDGDAGSGVAGDEDAGEEPIAALLANADAGAGKSAAKKCAACHTFDEGGKNKIGPALWNVVDRPVAAAKGFKYSDALKAFADGGTVWDFERLNGFLTAPKKYVSGTSMGFAGLKKPTERANIIAYLRTLAGDPAPLPPAAAEAPATEAPVAEAPAAEAPAAEAAPAKTEAEAASAETATEAAMSPVLAMIGEMTVGDGKKVAKKCAACHSFDEGGKNKVGPPLWGILNRAAGTADKFKYSAAMKAFATRFQ